MFNYCHAHPEAGLGDDRQFGFRADTEKYAFLLRVNPYPNDYNLYCYCYERRWLDRHLEQAARGIRFIDPHYKELFRIRLYYLSFLFVFSLNSYDFWLIFH